MSLLVKDYLEIGWSIFEVQEVYSVIHCDFEVIRQSIFIIIKKKTFGFFII